MEEWKKVKLVDYYQISSGLSKSADQFGSGYPFLSFKDVFWNYFLPEDLTQLVNTDEKEQEKCSVRKGDVFLTRTSEKVEELGMSSVALKDYPKATFNGFTKRLRPISNEIDHIFIGFYLRSIQFRAEITAYSSLTTRASLNNGIIGRLQINLPPLPTQRKIATILSAYDDLIENNLKRIKLLEEKAQLTYEEWFVRMRFPGHDTTPIDKETGLPEGWKKDKVSKLFELQRGFDLPIRHRVSGHIPIIASTGIVDYHNIYKVKGPGVVTGRSGTIGQAQIVLSDFWPLNTSLWVKKWHLANPSYAFHFLKMIDLKRFAGGSAVPSLDRKVVHHQKVINPPKYLIEQFGEYHMLLIKQVELLNKQNILLKEARDILLPRLMTGMIDVDALITE